MGMKINSTQHRIWEIHDNKMMISDWNRTRAIAVAERQTAQNDWTVSPVSAPHVSDVTVQTRREAVDVLCEMATEIEPEDGHSVFVPYKVLPDKTKLHLRDKP